MTDEEIFLLDVKGPFTSSPIYSRDASGKIRVWQYEVDGPRWRTRHGLHDSAAVTPSGWTTCVPKSQPTAEAQALFEARAEMGKKLDRDYRPSLEEVDVPRKAGPKPMLAHKFDEKSPIGPWASQPKLDGIRCISNRDGLWTREGKPIVSCPHVSAALAPWFAALPNLVLDGELYNHDLRDNFNKISSLVRKVTLTDEQFAETASLVQYHIYDVINDQLYHNRLHDLQYELFKMGDGDMWPVGTLSMVPTIWVRNREHLDQLYADFIECGYEGQMVRVTNMPYEHKRSKTLLKRKTFLDDEFKLLRIEPGNGNWAGYGKRVVFELADGRECGAGVKGDQAFTKDLLVNVDQYVGKKVTIRYFTPTPDGMPRFPVAVDFHLDEAGRVD